MPDNQINDLEKWFQERHQWLQDAARRIIQNGRLAEQDYAELLSICIAEANKKPVAISGISAGTLDVQETTNPLRLVSISEVQGVNALNPSKPLGFGNNQICIIYGGSGAGKSSYVRLLKHACGVRHAGMLLPNVFGKNDQPQTAKFSFIEKTETKVSQWTGSPLPELLGLDIYDNACGLVYLNEENEVAFEPWLLRIFTQLTEVCEEISRRVHAKMAAIVSNKPLLPAEYMLTTSAMWYTNVSANTTMDEVNSETNWTPENEDELILINKRLAEVNPVAKASAIRQQKMRLVDVLSDIKECYDNLSDERCNGYLQAKANAKIKRKAADDDAGKVFEKAPLEGVGTESWRMLWDAARKYSLEYAYKTEDFPNIKEDARCVLCQQRIEEGRDRMGSFEKYIKGELYNLADQAERDLEALANSFVEIPTPAILAARMEAAGMMEDIQKIVVIDFIAQLNKRKKMLFEKETMSGILPLPARNRLIPLVQVGRGLLKRAHAYEKDSIEHNRAELEARSRSLAVRKWLNQQKPAIGKEIDRMTKLVQLRAADELTNTTALSRRKSILADELITNAYIQRFKDELEKLRAGNLSVDLKKSRTEVGRVYHRICLKNAKIDVKTSDVLSDGELRVVSLAAFLADTEGRGAKTPFVFDDPISSLDIEYEEATAQRLVMLGKTRQIIIFTHRLSLVGFLEKYAGKYDVKSDLVCLSRFVPGETSELPINLGKTDKAVNALLNERFAAAKKALGRGEGFYENEAKGLCRDIRILMERVVERDMLNEIVSRFKQDVNTKGKIHALAKITEGDCKFVDDIMTKYSSYEHSQPDEAPVSLPKPDEIEKDLKNISEFIKKIKERNNA